MAGPERIVCLTEETTELLYLLGEERRIVGITAYTVRPPRAKQEKPVVSAFIGGSVEKIKALEPDLVVGFSDIQAEFARTLIAEGLNVLITNQRSIHEIFETMMLIGRIVNRGSETEELVSGFREKLRRTEDSRSAERPAVFFQEWDDPLISCIEWVSELIEIAGGMDIFAGRRGAMARDRIVTIEEVIRHDPEVIIGSWCGKPVNHAWVTGHLGETRAVKAGRVVEVDSSIILQPGPALFLEGIDAIVRAVRGEGR